MRATFVKFSRNKKTGPIPVTMTHRNSCPDVCLLKNNGCYAEGGRVAINWLSSFDYTSISWDKLCYFISKLPRNALWRHNIAGDLPGNNNIIDHGMLNQLVIANNNRLGFTYTHKPVGFSGQELINARAIYASNKSGFTINLSANNLAEADNLSNLNIAPVVVLLASDAPQKTKTPEGRTVIACPAETNDIQCVDCKLCAKSSRKSIVGFRAHGISYKKAEKHLKVIQSM